MFSFGLNILIGVETGYYLSKFLNYESTGNSLYSVFLMSVSILRAGAYICMQHFCLPAQSLSSGGEQSRLVELN